MTINNQALKPGLYAVLYRDNWDGEGDTYETLATLDSNLIWHDHESGKKLLEYEGDVVLKVWALDDGSNLLALLDELEAAEKRIAELEAREVRSVMFIDGDISPADAEKLAAVIRQFNEETESPAARMARIIRENPHPTNMCDMPAAGISIKGE